MKLSADSSQKDVLPALEGRFEVMLGLALEPSPPEGNCPSLEDLAGWHDGTLPQSRVPDVQAHLARCRECYSIWFGLVECSGVYGAEAVTPGLFGRLATACERWLIESRPWSVIATGLAAAGVAAVYFLVSAQPTWTRTIDRGYQTLSAAVAQSAPSAARWTWGGGLGVRGIENPWERLAELRMSHAHEAARAAFGVGVRAGLSETLHDTSEWTSVIAALPTEAPACAPAALPKACEEINRTFEHVGRWAVLLHFACLLDRQRTGGTHPDAAFWRDQIGVLEKVGDAIDASVPADAFDRFFTDWRKEALAGDDPRGALCAREESLLSLGLD